MPRLLLRCPECLANNHRGDARIGNRRNECMTCNRFAQAVRRETARRLAAEFPRATRRIRQEAEQAVYDRLAAQSR